MGICVKMDINKLAKVLNVDTSVLKEQAELIRDTSGCSMWSARESIIEERVLNKIKDLVNKIDYLWGNDD